MAEHYCAKYLSTNDVPSRYRTLSFFQTSGVCLPRVNPAFPIRQGRSFDTVSESRDECSGARVQGGAEEAEEEEELYNVLRMSKNEMSESVSEVT